MPAENPSLARWDERFSASGYVYGTDPNAFLVRERWRLEPGMSVLAVADGEGRNGVWLAQQGMRVTSVDGSAVGLRKLLQLAQKRGVAVATHCADLTAWNWPKGKFDAVAAIYLHFRPEVRARMHAAMLAALKPGGLLLLEAFRPEQLELKSGGPPVAEMLYDTALLTADFGDAEILLLEEATPELSEGPGHNGPAATVRLVARRPE